MIKSPFGCVNLVVACFSTFFFRFLILSLHSSVLNPFFPPLLSLFSAHTSLIIHGLPYRRVECVIFKTRNSRNGRFERKKKEERLRRWQRPFAVLALLMRCKSLMAIVVYQLSTEDRVGIAAISVRTVNSMANTKTFERDV